MARDDANYDYAKQKQHSNKDRFVSTMIFENRCQPFSVPQYVAISLTSCHKNAKEISLLFDYNSSQPIINSV